MRTFLLGCILAGGMMLALCPERASAQFYPYLQPYANPYGTPAISPYLNMNRGGFPAINYYGLVQPQVNTAKQLQMLQQNQAVQTQLGLIQDQDALTAYAITGHPTAFSNYSHYFGRGAGSSGGALGGLPAGPGLLGGVGVPVGGAGGLLAAPFVGGAAIGAPAFGRR